ncbi:hypothetical protein [Halorussus aquaticus]|uniref:Uncharacterized protein n=1 Tax=Halorussus aquaticus TaxID=2953748 RepID=A0ABD5Q3W9_9EURY|nr:hypothetical protein [Halorussus aquaticus]
MTDTPGETRRERGDRSWRLTSIVAALLLLTAGCTAGPSATSTSTAPPTADSATATSTAPDGPPTDDGENATKRHPSLDSRLVRLLNATDRSAYAARNGLTFRNGSVLVIVELRQNRTLPAGFTEDVRTRHGRLVQASVPASTLRSLADHANVSYVRPPRQPVTEAPSQETPGNDTTNS